MKFTLMSQLTVLTYFLILIQDKIYCLARFNHYEIYSIFTLLLAKTLTEMTKCSSVME